MFSQYSNNTKVIFIASQSKRSKTLAGKKKKKKDVNVLRNRVVKGAFLNVRTSLGTLLAWYSSPKLEKREDLGLKAQILS